MKLLLLSSLLVLATVPAVLAQAPAPATVKTKVKPVGQPSVKTKAPLALATKPAAAPVAHAAAPRAAAAAPAPAAPAKPAGPVCDLTCQMQKAVAKTK